MSCSCMPIHCFVGIILFGCGGGGGKDFHFNTKVEMGNKWRNIFMCLRACRYECKSLTELSFFIHIISCRGGEGGLRGGMRQKWRHTQPPPAPSSIFQRAYSITGGGCIPTSTGRTFRALVRIWEPHCLKIDWEKKRKMTGCVCVSGCVCQHTHILRSCLHNRSVYESSDVRVTVKLENTFTGADVILHWQATVK